MAWTTFWDMHSGGGSKLDHDIFFIEAPEQVARAVFEDLFDRDPDHVTCDCCGPDYSVYEVKSIEEDLAHHKRWVTDDQIRILHKSDFEFKQPDAENPRGKWVMKETDGPARG